MHDNYYVINQIKGHSQDIYYYTYFQKLQEKITSREDISDSGYLLNLMIFFFEN